MLPKDDILSPTKWAWL